MVINLGCSTAVNRRLRVRVRRTVSGAGESTWAMSVWCPRVCHSVSATNCQSCRDCRTVEIGMWEPDPFVLCGAVPPNDELGAGPPTRADCVEQTAVGSIMTTEVICVTPDLSVQALMGLLLVEGFSGVPVVDEEGVPIGIVSKTDLVREFCQGREDHDVICMELAVSHERFERVGAVLDVEVSLSTTVGEIMAPLAYTLPESASVAKAAALMAYEGVHRIPIVGCRGEVVGVLSALDILAQLAGDDGYVLPQGGHRRRGRDGGLIPR